jgi:hypothetical protein
MSDFGDFQANVGKVSASVRLISAYIFGGIFCLIGLFLVVGGFFQKPDDPEIEKCSDDDICKSDRIYMIIGGFVMVAVAIIAIVVSRWWKKQTETNRTAAQIGGAATEISLLRNLLSR